VISRLNRDLKSADRTARCCAAALRLVCREMQLSPGEIRSRRRAERWVVARWVLIWLARKAGRLSLREIGRYVNQSHGAVVLGLRRLPDLIETQPALAKKLAAMERELAATLDAEE
jgi:chromosomal replication initiation ATPase DnaA